MIKKKILPINIIEYSLFYSFGLFPISFLIGNFVINFFLLLFSLLFITGFLKNKFKINNQNNVIIILLLFFFLSLIINLLFTNNIQLSYPRVLKFILIIGSILSFSQLLTAFEYNKIIKLYKIWTIIFLFVLFDIIFEIIFKVNILGFKSIIPGRIVSFSGNEMTIGHFFSAFSLLIISYIQLKLKKSSLLTLLISVMLIIISFLIGERSNFVRTFLIISAFITITNDINFKFKIITIISIISLFIIIINQNENYKNRYFVQFAESISKNGINLYLNNSIYGAHYKVAYEIFKDNRLFGVGIKNFRIESYSNKYDNLNHNQPERRGNTHPHQIHLEFLSETGLFGYASFLIFIIISMFISIKNYLKFKNLFQLSSILYISASLLPLLPSGSFFSTYTSGLFWINYAIMIGYNYKK